MLMLAYSALLAFALLLSAPWWLFRMATTQRYREGLKQRLGLVPAALRLAVAGKRILWLHAVSVGETLAATRLVAELEAALGPGCCVVISTTTRTGHALAKERFGAERVFYMPLDFAFAVRAYLNALKPAALILMESELWPRLLHECQARGIPVAVVNARVSDRSYRRARRVRMLWSHILRKPTLWLAQSEEDARRVALLIETPVSTNPVLSTVAKRSGKIPAFASASTGKPAILLTGNLKYDTLAQKESWIAELIREAAMGRPIIVAGSTIKADRIYEDLLVVQAWRSLGSARQNALLVIAPRHPEYFEEVYNRAHEYRALNATSMMMGSRSETAFADSFGDNNGLPVEVILLDTIGDLASVYAIADIAFVGGSLVRRGGHNPLEPAQFGVPVIMGPSFENFRDIVSRMQAADGIRIVQDAQELEATLIDLLTHPAEARALGERGRGVFEQQQGATARTVQALLEMLRLPAEGTPSFAKDAKDGAPGMDADAQGSGMTAKEERQQERGDTGPGALYPQVTGPGGRA